MLVTRMGAAGSSASRIIVAGEAHRNAEEATSAYVQIYDQTIQQQNFPVAVFCHSCNIHVRSFRRNDVPAN